MKESLIELGCSGEKIIVQHLGVDLEKITFMSRELAADNEIKVLIAGSFREKKGIPYAIEAIGRIKQSRPDISLRLTIIGDSSGREREEKQKEKILSAIQKHGLSDCVKMMGYQPHAVFISELYSHHLFLSPSVQASDGDTEGGAPVSIIEASASGMPVLSTIHCDIPEVVINGEGGYLVPERNIDALAERLEFLVINHEQWGKMGRAGRKHIVRNYDIKKQVRKLEGIYDDVSNRRYV